MSRFTSIIAFRVVTQQLSNLVTFYETIGFIFDGMSIISTDEMQLLGLDGSGRRARLILGNSAIELDEFAFPGQRYPASVFGGDPRFQHLALITTDIKTAWANVLAAGALSISTIGPVRLPASSGGVTAVKFRDPEGHPLELLQFPPHAQASQALIERIDHSAISVMSVAASIDFYERSGLLAAGRTLNEGTAQSALDAVADACVDVVPMKPADAPPHIELLHYRGITPGINLGVAVNDVCATRVVWQADADALVVDPDGHRHQLSSRTYPP